MNIRNAMVLAAGLGTRMRPITNTIPKPLIRIGGKPMLDYVLDILAQASVANVVVNVHYLADQMEAHLAREKRFKILISDERAKLMDSGGGLAKGLKLLDRSPVFVMNADLFWIGEKPGAPSNLARLADFFDSARMDMALLCVAPEKTTGHNGKNDFSMGEAGRLVRYRENYGAPVVYAGALVMNPALLDDAPADAFNLNVYFDRAIAGGRLYGMMLEGEWLTVGSPDAIAPAEALIARLQDGR